MRERLVSCLPWLLCAALSGCQRSHTKASPSLGEAGVRTDVGVAARPVDGASSEGEGSGPAIAPRLLVFTRTEGFRHDSIPDGLRAVQEMATRRGWSVTAGEDPGLFTDERLGATDVVVFLLTSGDILDPPQEAALERFVARGGGIVGVHSASDTEYEWPTWESLFGTYFKGHPPGTPRARLSVVDVAHPATRPLPKLLMRDDEWYSFRADPAQDGATRSLLTIDEESYGPPPELRMGHHPVSWSRFVRGGRVFYTALGHTSESYREAAFLAHLEGGISWAAGARDAKVVTEELDGTNRPGVWEPQGPFKDFRYDVGKDGLVMHDAGGGNQHLTRRGLFVDARRPYAVEALFTSRPDASAGAPPNLNSFCLNVAVQGREGVPEDRDRLDAWAVNLDLPDQAGAPGVLKHMGFVDGAFREIGQTRTGCCRLGVEYRLRVEVNVAADGATKPGFLTVTLSEGAKVHERFTVDYGGFPWQPDLRRPVQVGANTHGADWTMRHFRVVYLD